MKTRSISLFMFRGMAPKNALPNCQIQDCGTQLAEREREREREREVA